MGGLLDRLRSTRRVLARRVRDERGAAVTVWTVAMVTSFVLIVGVAVDLTGLVHAKSNVGEMAAQAARQAGQQVTRTSAQGGSERLEVRAARARSAAVSYLEARGMTGTATVSGGSTLAVTATDLYVPRFLSAIGAGPVSVSAQAQARLVFAVEGEEQG